MDNLSLSCATLLEKLNGVDVLLTLHDRFGGSFHGKLLHYSTKTGSVVLCETEADDFVSFHQLEDIASIKLHTKVEQLGWLTGKSVIPLAEPSCVDFDLDDYVYQAKQMLSIHLKHAIKITFEQIPTLDVTAKLERDIERVL